MQPEIEKKVDLIFLRKTLRLDNNPLIHQGDTFVLIDNAYEFNGTPFKNLKNTNYQSFYQINLTRFENELKNLGKIVKRVTTLEELIEVCRDKNVVADKVIGIYEEKLEYELAKECHLTLKRDLNYLLEIDDGILELLKPKMGFSAFRKKTEKIATTRSHSSEMHLDSNHAHKAYKNYLNSKAPLTYFETRNALMGDQFSTRLSDKLNLGQLSPKHILSELEKFEATYGQNKSTYWIKFELLWREYFYWLYQVHDEEFFRSLGLNGGDFKLAPLSVDEYLNKMNNHQLIKCMNKELMQTGFLSNRSRQIYVSYLIHETDLDWRYGAWFFQHFLNDYDLYSNWGNWLYGSGNGTDARGPRYFKISKQLSQYDPNNEYIKYWENIS